LLDVVRILLEGSHVLADLGEGGALARFIGGRVRKELVECGLSRSLNLLGLLSRLVGAENHEAEALNHCSVQEPALFQFLKMRPDERARSWGAVCSGSESSS
jgi:hypothetical protein